MRETGSQRLSSEACPWLEDKKKTSWGEKKEKEKRTIRESNIGSPGKIKSPQPQQK